MRISFIADDVSITPNSAHEIEVDADGVDSYDLLQEIEMKEAITYYTAAEILDEIGQDAVVEHFGLGPED